jgi:peptidoglycan/LPS O-acetylase OafA/YrhL
MFKRRPSALAPLDGIRFMAVMWVVMVHYRNLTPNWAICTKMEKHTWFWYIIRNGDMGVDIFFVLSGFLIAFVLNREYSKF